MRYPEEKRRALTFTDDEKSILLKAGIIPALITNWKLGRSLPGKYLAREVAVLLDKPLVEILYGNSPKPEKGFYKRGGIKKKKIA